ncbi:MULTISPECIES: hypothetical protein [unclassified Streptomyces]|uniref:hypothetical protein n=1 Tax=unclassified Streptomyces TaxID=2593676 RepID=UPI0003734DDB|nr:MULTISPECIES: hypothetical protein [unclassified Streptomyces]MYT28961.1 hypothetical protein [Streptomyces sp. SID8354]
MEVPGRREKQNAGLSRAILDAAPDMTAAAQALTTAADVATSHSSFAAGAAR